MKRKILRYDSKLKTLAKELRKNMTYAEIALWSAIRNKTLKGYKFRRQVPISNYIVDFYCPELMLVIEIDGRSHDLKQDKDVLRQQELEKFGLKIIRFSEAEVIQNLNGVSKALFKWVEDFEKNNDI